MNKRVVLALTGIACLVLVGWTIMEAAGDGNSSQPIAFNHKLHKEMGLECIDCHPFFQTERYAGRPSIEVCLECHEEAMTDSAEEAKIREYATDKKDIPWKGLYRLADHVFFTHHRHIVEGGLECEVCHGKIGETDKPPSKPLKTLTMSDCMDCHWKRGANNDCLACHW